MTRIRFIEEHRASRDTTFERDLDLLLSAFVRPLVLPFCPEMEEKRETDPQEASL